MLVIMALRAPVSPRLLAVTPERAAWLQRVAFALQVLLAARSGVPCLACLSSWEAAALLVAIVNFFPRRSKNRPKLSWREPKIFLSEDEPKIGKDGHPGGLEPPSRRIVAQPFPKSDRAAI